ncbi:glycosyltransferase family 25 protein [Pseudonocardiaceae bacterium YIM PH 21723]|nr:glycosyltransferase family 25 protein [Pseudonocardiaceae bacterium YIM PH 21723]
MITAADLRTYVINLPRRPDRRAWISRTLPPELKVTFTSDWTGPYDGRDLTVEALHDAGYALFPWQIDSDNPWWNRPLKFGEIGCTLAHLACWQDAEVAGDERFIVVLEDDAVLPTNFDVELIAGLNRAPAFDLLYLGRVPLEPDLRQIDGFAVPGYSHCTYGYVVSRAGLRRLLRTGISQALVPVDEFLPAMYVHHPRPDLQAQFPQQLTALAFDPPLVKQRPKEEAGSDTEDSEFAQLPSRQTRLPS